jgi:hypothetical protein
MLSRFSAALWIFPGARASLTPTKRLNLGPLPQQVAYIRQADIILIQRPSNHPCLPIAPSGATFATRFA